MTSVRLRRLDRDARKASTLILLGMTIGGCSSEGQSDWIALWTAAKQSFSDAGSAVTLDQAGAIPYATLGIRISGGPQQLLVLATDNGNDRIWTSSSHVAIETDNGRVVRTAGLQSDLAGYVPLQGSGVSWQTAHEYRWSADFADINRYSITVVCRDDPGPLESIVILGQTLTVRRIDETCEAGQIDWRFGNTYWIDPQSGRAWRSIQNIHPGSGPIEVEILRPPSAPG